MMDLHWPEALDPGKPDLAAAHRRARELIAVRRRRAGMLFLGVAVVVGMAVVVPLVSGLSTSTDLAVPPPAESVPTVPAGPLMTIAPNPSNTPRADATPTPVATQSGEAPPPTPPQVGCYDGPANAEPAIAIVETDGRPHVEVCADLWAAGEVGSGPVPDSFVTCRQDGGGLAVLPGASGDCAANGMTEIVTVPDLQDLAAGDFGPYYIGFVGNQFGYPATWQFATLPCGNPPTEAIRIAPPDAPPPTCDMSGSNAGILALPADNWPTADGTTTLPFAHQAAELDSDADGATTYRFDVIDLVLRINYRDDPGLVQAILDSVDTDRPPPPSDGPNFDDDLGARIAADLQAAAPPGLEVDISGLEGGGGVPRQTTARVSVHLFRSAQGFEDVVARMIPGNCPPLTVTFTDDCGQLVNVNGRRIAIVMPNDSYYHAFSEAPDGHILNVIVHGAGSPDTLSVEETIDWLSDADALFG